MDTSWASLQRLSTTVTEWVPGVNTTVLPLGMCDGLPSTDSDASGAPITRSRTSTGVETGVVGASAWLSLDVEVLVVGPSEAGELPCPHATNRPNATTVQQLFISSPDRQRIAQNIR
jgi:hypothetical protein